MAFDFHKDKATYFNIQYENSKTYVVPFVAPFVKLGAGTTVLEIGSAEAGVLKAFTELGCTCTGIELHEGRVKLANEFMAKEVAEGKAQFISRNIYDMDPEKDLDHKFDLIILKDVIEHIHDQERFVKVVGNFLRPGGKIFYGFPPWYMPFGGHQQICKSKFLSVLPYYHLLPVPLYRGMLKLFGERQKIIDDLLEIKETGISIERFVRIHKDNGFQVKRKQFFLINPIYKYKFNLKVRNQAGFIAALPFVRNFFTTAVYYLVDRSS